MFTISKNCTAAIAIWMAKDLIQRHLVEDHSINGWTVIFDRCKRRFGYCQYDKKIISLSEILILINTVERVRNTILHEIAHVIVGRGFGHGTTWSRLASKLGCPTRRNYSCNNTNIPKGLYSLICDACGKTTQWYRRPEISRSCGRCSPDSPDPNYIMRLVINS